MRIALPRAAAAAASLIFVQSASAAVYTFKAELDAAQVVAGGGSHSTATGVALVAINSDLYTVTTTLTWSGLTGPADRAHLHSGAEGQTSDDVFFHDVLYVAWPSDTQGPTVPCAWGTFGVCVPASGVSHDVLQLSASNGYGYSNFASMINAFQQGDIYIDMHTQIYPEGEIRGQVEPIPELPAWAMMALGLVSVSLTGYGNAMFGRITARSAPEAG